MSFSAEDIQALVLTFKLASTTTVILFLVGTPLAWGLARCKSKFKIVLEALLSMPLILPPTVLGFYLLLALGPNGVFGFAYDWMGITSLAFSFPGLVIGSVFYSLPFMVQPIQDAFESIPNGLFEVAATLRANPMDRFFSIALPNAKAGLLTGIILSFAHTVGEFGVVLMLGGNIPGKTKVVSIAIYDYVEMLQYDNAHLLAGFLMVVSFAMLLFVYAINRRFSVVHS
jgi:molybdate transport system permease protein